MIPGLKVLWSNPEVEKERGRTRRGIFGLLEGPPWMHGRPGGRETPTDVARTKASAAMETITLLGGHSLSLSAAGVRCSGYGYS